MKAVAKFTRKFSSKFYSSCVVPLFWVLAVSYITVRDHDTYHSLTRLKNYRNYHTCVFKVCKDFSHVLEALHRNNFVHVVWMVLSKKDTVRALVMNKFIVRSTGDIRALQINLICRPTEISRIEASSDSKNRDIQDL